MLRCFSTILAFFLLALAAAEIHAAPDRWVKLGQRHVSDRVDHDVIRVGVDDGRFSSIQLRAAGSRVKVRNVVVVFADGSRQEYSRNFTLARGERSPAVDLRGDRRVIREVRFVYEESSIRRRGATVHLWGRR
ncbi:MAG: hypothetical protein AAGM22_09385 [Acidobacteriota bacterium]